MKPLSSALPILWVIFGTLSSAISPILAQDDIPSPQVALDYIKQLVRLKNVASHEKAAWLEEEASLRDRMALLAKELVRLKELVERAGESDSEGSTKRVSLMEEEASLKAAAFRLERLLDGLEGSVIQLASYFPSPLLETTKGARQRLQDRSLNRRNRDRLKDLLAILLDTEKFQRSISVDREWRVLSDKREVEVQVLYLGLGQAFYVAEGNQEAGIGYPRAQGWQWEARPDIAKTVRKALEILEDHPEQARFQTLPVKLRPVSP